MSNAALDLAFSVPIKGSLKVVLIVLANHADENGISWPGMKRIGLHAGITERAAQIAIAKLERMALISVVRNSGSQNRYHLLLDAISTFSDSGERRSPPPRTTFTQTCT